LGIKPVVKVSDLESTRRYYDRAIRELPVYLDVAQERVAEARDAMRTEIASKLSEFLRGSTVKSIVMDSMQMGLDEGIEAIVNDGLARAEEIGYPFTDLTNLKMVLVFGVVLHEELMKDYYSEIQPDNMARLERCDFREICELYRTQLNIDLESEFDNWRCFRTNRKRRNLIVHNRGLVDQEGEQVYRLGKAGQPVSVLRDDVQGFVSTLIRFNTFLFDRMSQITCRRSNSSNRGAMDKYNGTV
jgi:hypothetical protein